MAFIYFYDTTNLDKKQLSEALEHTDHRWEFVDEKISLENINPETEAISIFVTSTVDIKIIEALPKLRVIACRSTGFNNIDLEAANDHGVTVVNVPTYGEQTVAEYTFTLLLTLVRNVDLVLQTENEKFNQADLTGHDLGGKTLGVIGTGHIGRKTIQIARGFSMPVLAYDAFPDEKLEKELGFTYVSLEELLKNSRIVSLHLPYLPATHHILDDERLQMLRPGSVIINTARGELIDTAALVKHLQSGQIGGAALDVIEGEALLNYDEETALLRDKYIPHDMLQHSLEIMTLKSMPNVIVSPHNAFNTFEAIGRINKKTVKNIVDFWHGNTPNVVKAGKKPVGKLVVIRHAESEWNATGKWTGVTDVHLSEKGFHESTLLGIELRSAHIPIDIAYCSEQIRSRETLESVLSASQNFNTPVRRESAINERNYGDYTGKNKWQMKETVGEERFHDIRRGWDVAIPNGETLKMVYERAVPFYKKVILPQLLEGNNVLIVSHGNSIRALMKYIENISNEDVQKLEMIFGIIVVYGIDEQGKMADKKVLSIGSPPPNA